MIEKYLPISYEHDEFSVGWISPEGYIANNKLYGIQVMTHEGSARVILHYIYGMEYDDIDNLNMTEICKLMGEKRWIRFDYECCFVPEKLSVNQRRFLSKAKKAGYNPYPMKYSDL